MSLPVISVEHLSKAFRLGMKEEIPDTFVGAAKGWLKAPLRNWKRLRRLNTFDEPVSTPLSADLCPPTPDSDTLWALRDVSFDIQEGEVVGIIGRNGAGKSTLLKILSRITEPTHGRAVIRGRVSSLLEVGTGFHPELSGRENIYMNGTILGMRKKEIDRKFDEIVDFSGVEKFLDTPVKRYSSGMTVRLAFAVAAHLEPEILIIDEVLAVGDAEFQKKCLGKMQDVAKAGRTVLFVSHNMPAVRSLTTRAVYLSDGKLRYAGGTDDTINAYLSAAIEVASRTEQQNLEYYRRRRSQDSPVRFTRIWIDSAIPRAGKLPRLDSTNFFSIRVELESTLSITDSCLSLSITRNHEQRVTTLFSKDVRFEMPLDSGAQAIRCTIIGLSLAPGLYTLDAGINKNANAVAFDVVLDIPLFEVEFPELRTGDLDWPNRPWGAVHWSNVKWERI